MTRPAKLNRETSAGSLLPVWEPPLACDFVLTLTTAEFARLIIALSVCRTLHPSRTGRARHLQRHKCLSQHRRQWCRIGKQTNLKLVDTRFG